MRYLALFLFAAAFFAFQGVAHADDVEHELRSVGAQLEAGSASKPATWQRYANLRKDQEMYMWITSHGAPITVQVLDPTGRVWFEAAYVKSQSKPDKKIYTYGFEAKAPRVGAYTIRFMNASSSKTRVVSHGAVLKTEELSVPGTWALNYKDLAFAILNEKGQSLENSPRLEAALKRNIKITLAFKADGTFTVFMANSDRRQTNKGTWSQKGSTITLKTTHADGKSINGKTEEMFVEDFQLGMAPRYTGLPVAVYMDKIS